jgi:hypothetical protein
VSDSPYNLFRQIREELADGMKEVGYESFDWGQVYQWDQLSSEGYNVSVIFEAVDGEDRNYLESWTAEDENRYLAIQRGEDGTGDALIFSKFIKQSRPQILEDMNIRSFSFDTKDIRINHRKMTERLSAFNSNSNESKSQWERFIGGILHMCRGKIWTLEDLNENIMAAVLFGSVDGENWLIEAMGSNDSVDPNKEYLKVLLENTLERYSKNNCFVYSKQSSWKFGVLQALGFEPVESFQTTRQLH